MLETASIYSGALVAVVIAIVLLAYIAVSRHKNRKLAELEENGINGVDIGDSVATGIDTVDGYTRAYAVPLNASVGGRALVHPPRSQAYVQNGNRPVVLRPFGPHHHHTIPMSKSLSR